MGLEKYYWLEYNLEKKLEPKLMVSLLPNMDCRCSGSRIPICKAKAKL